MGVSLTFWLIVHIPRLTAHWPLQNQHTGGGDIYAAVSTQTTTRLLGLNLSPSAFRTPIAAALRTWTPAQGNTPLFCPGLLCHCHVSLQPSNLPHWNGKTQDSVCLDSTLRWTEYIVTDAKSRDTYWRLGKKKRSSEKFIHLSALLNCVGESTEALQGLKSESVGPPTF